MFAYYYYACSERLTFTLKEKKEKQDQAALTLRLNLINGTILFLNASIPLLDGVLSFSQG
jgi:hypothetical protein